MDYTSLSTQVGEALRRKGWTISAAESCTGGLLLARLTDIAGSSAYVIGGVVTYSNEAKQQWVNVQESTLIQHGAVSAQTALEMAQGARERFGTDLAVSITGIAGPGGGTPEKPVGLTYIGIASHEGIRVEQYIWPGNRVENRDSSVEAALKLILQAAGG